MSYLMIAPHKASLCVGSFDINQSCVNIRRRIGECWCIKACLPTPKVAVISYERTSA